MALSTLVIGILAVLLFISVTRHRKYRLPPGPPGLPILGNFLDIPKAGEWLTYNEWGRKYGTQNGMHASMYRHSPTARF